MRIEKGIVGANAYKVVIMYKNTKYNVDGTKRYNNPAVQSMSPGGIFAVEVHPRVALDFFTSREMRLCLLNAIVLRLITH